DELLFRLIHDVRAILRKGHIRAQMLEQKVGGQLDAEARGMLEHVLSSQRELDQLLARLAAYADAGRSAAEERVSLDTVIFGAELHVKDAREAAGGEIVNEKAPGVRVPAALQGALVEVFQNSIRFRREDEPLRIAISVQVSAAGGRVICITDNGPAWEAAQ